MLGGVLSKSVFHITEIQKRDLLKAGNSVNDVMEKARDVFAAPRFILDITLLHPVQSVQNEKQRGYIMRQILNNFSVRTKI